jgi:hypothetical protein
MVVLLLWSPFGSLGSSNVMRYLYRVVFRRELGDECRWFDALFFQEFQRLAWGLSEVSESTGLSVAFLRAEVRAGGLPVRRFGRRC